MKFHHTPVLSKRDVEKGLKFPDEMSENLAEIVGIHFGDGSMSKHNSTYRIRWCLNTRDVLYANYTLILFKNCFGMNMKKMANFQKHSLELYVLSKAVCEFFNKFLEIPYSPKKYLIIPQYILENKIYLAAFLRGLFDTDGCFTIKEIKDIFILL